MVKFGKQLRAEQLEDYKKDYIDYKKLKQIIKEIRNAIIQNDQNNKERDFAAIESNIKLGSPSSHDTNSNIIKLTGSYGETGGKKENQNSLLLKKFKDALDAEIKKTYIFFAGKERELYVLINSHLHIRQSYEGLSLTNIKKEVGEIKKISNIALNVSKFIHLNMTAIKKILKKFDKNFQHIFGKITFPYIQKKLELKHSDLLYILNLKIIDEVSAIIEDLMRELKTLTEKKSGRAISRLSKSNNNKILSNSEYEQQDFSDKLIINDRGTIKSELEEMRSTFSELESNIFLIDELNHSFRNSFKEWTFHLKNTNRAYNNGYSIVAKTSILGLPVADNNLDRSCRSGSITRFGGLAAASEILSYRKNSFESEILFTSENLNNIYITLAHSFMFMFAYSIVIPTNCIYMNKIGVYKYNSGLSLGMTPIGTIFSLFLDRKMTDYSYKKPLLLSVFFYILSAILYIIAGSANSFTLILLSRFILGVGSFRFLNRTYLTLFVGQKKISKYLLYFQLCSLVGLASGPLFSIPLSLIGQSEAFADYRLDDIFNECTLPSWMLLILNCILMLLVIVYYTEPLDLNFMAFRDGISSETRSISIDRERMSLKEKNMIDHIDDKLNQINETNNFSDTNLVSRHIQQIASKESKTNSYLYKCFIVFVILLIIVRMTTETLLVITPLYLVEIEFNGQDAKSQKEIEKTLLPLISFLISLSLFLIIPVGYFFQKKIFNNIRERRIILYFTIICLLFNLLIINYFFTSIYQYCIAFIFFMIATNLLENTTTTMFSKIIPSDYRVNGFNAGFIINISTSLGRSLGCCIITFLGSVHPETLNRVSFGVTGGLLLVGLIVLGILYPNLRVKAIARILRGRASVRKHKATEF